MLSKLLLAYRALKALYWIYKTSKQILKEKDKIKAKLKKKELDKALNLMVNASNTKEQLAACIESKKILKSAKKCVAKELPPVA